MEQATIIKRDGTKINLISKDPFRAPTSFSQEYGLKSDDYVKISLKSSDMLKFGIGDRIIIGSDTYTIRTNNTTEIVSDNSYTYELTFYGAMYDLMRQMYRNCDAQGKSDKSTFDLTYSLKDFAKVIIYNMERDYPGEWVLDENNVPDTDEKTITFDGQNCLQVLQTLCNSDNYDYDFLITQEDGVHTLHLGKFGSVITPPNNESYFEVGKGKGLYKLKEDKVDDKSIITRLYVEGGSTNIRSEYRDYAGRLQLPYPQRANTRAHTLSDGTVIAAGSMTIGITDDTKRYFEDADLKNKIGSIEDYDKTDDIFPCRTGKVTALGADVYSFVDNTMDFDLNEKDSNGTKWLIADTTAKITFTSGYLAGQQFELKKSGGYVHATKTFTLIKYTDERGMSFPSETAETFQIRVGDTYKITDINLPTAYENDAEEDLWFYGYDKFLQAKQARVQYTATFTEDFFLHHLPTDSTADIFHVGDYLPIKDTRFGVAKNIRITKVTRNLMKRYDYTLTVSDTNSETIVSQIVDEVINHETIINRYGMKDPSKARRGWRTTEDLRNMVFDTDGYFDGTNIKPNSIDTNMLTVGSKSQQFVLIGITLQANVNGLPNRFDASAGILAHLTIDEDSIKMWNLTATSVTLAESGGYYVYAKCSKSGNTGSYYITQEQLKFEPASDVDNYYFLIGVIGSLHADDNFRDFVTMYGFTRINGRTITTGRIISSDGYCYLDLDSNLFQLADAETIAKATSGIGWSNGKLTIKGVIVQNQGGNLAELGLYRGTYNSSTVYYKGDEVSYNDGSQTCTYRYTNATPGKGQLPTNTVYWAVVAKGEKGDQGIQGLQGIQGVKGDQGIPGTTGTDGKTTYFHIKYSDYADGTNMNETGGKYIGTYVDYTETDSTDKTKYKWVLIKGVQGDKGDQGIPGVNGSNGLTSYLHIKYSNDGGVTFTTNNGEDTGAYIGQYTDFVQLDSSDPTKYTWSKIKGDSGDSVKLLYRYEIDKPTKPTGSNPNGWSNTPDKEIIAVTHGTNFTLKDGYYVSPAISHSSIIKNRISFNTTKVNQSIAIELSVSSEPTYDCALIGILDDNNLTINSNYTKKISGITTIIAIVDIPNIGSHFIDVGYAKNSTASYNDDNCKYRIVDINKCWISTGYTISGLTTWSDPVIFINDNKSEEYIYAIEDSEITLASPKSDKYIDDFIPKRTYTDYSQSLTWAIGSEVIYNSNYYRCIITNSSTNVHLPTETLYWKQIEPWTDNPQGVSLTKRYEYISKRTKVNGVWGGFSIPTIWARYSVDGNDGSYFEYRYAKNGSTVTPPDLDTSAPDPTGWKTTIPTVGTLEYLWCTIAKKSASGSLLQNWSTPIRITPYDGTNGADGAKGDKGENPVLAFRGLYDAAKTYYGTTTRLDAVKYNGIYYIARIDAGSFSGTLPTSTSKWNTFGAELETIATNLLLAEGANIGDWFMSGGKIVSTLSDGNKITLDASAGEIILVSSTSGGDYSMDTGMGSKITLNVNTGVIEVEAVTKPSYSTATSYLSPSGIFANMAGTNAMPASSGYTHRGAIVGLGFANVNKNDWAFDGEDTIIAGVYGRASNSGTAPAYGGFFYNLFAGGLTLGRKCISSTTTVYLSSTKSLVVGYTSAQVLVYLPTDAKEGTVILFKQWWTGYMRIYPRSGQKLYDDSTQNDYYDVGEGEMLIAQFTIGYITSGSTTTKVEAWLVNKFKY